MADQTQTVGALPVDVSKVSGYGVPPESLQALRDALAKNVEALEQRYAQPNWFKVAAGFAKPQLGGFFASLGSAAQALGENVEQQRAVQLPIAQMRAQLAQSDILMAKNQRVAEMERDRKARNLPITPEYVAEVSAIAPGSDVATSLQSSLKTTMEQQQLNMQRIQTKAAQGFPLSLEEKAYLQGSVPETAKVLAPAVPPKAVDFNLGSMSPQDQIGFLKYVKEQETDPGIKAGIDAKLAELQGKSPAAPAAPKAPEAPKYFPATVVMPNLAGLPTREAEGLAEARRRDAAGLEKTAQDKTEKLAATSTGPFYGTMSNAYDSAINMMSTNPKLSAKVFNLVRSAGPLAAAAESGFGVHAGTFTANISLPVRNYLAANLKPEEQQFADTLLSHLTTIGNSKLKAQGMSTANTTQQEYMKMFQSAAGLDQTPQSAFQILRLDKANLDYNRNYYQSLMKERSKVDPNSLTPLHDVMTHSPELKRIDEENRLIQQRLTEDFNKRLGKKP